MSFTPVYDLTQLSEPQKQQYIVALCNHLGLPPELNLIRVIWSDEGDGGRKLVAYVLRGGTDILRDRKEISVTSLTSTVVNGSIVFTASGKDKEGRQEIAVGSSFIDGFKGKKLDDLIMTGQTRALRRLTLQFVGTGLLDESEINTTQDIATQSAPLSQLALAPQPTVKPNDAAGKDVTPLSTEALQKGAQALQKAFNTATDLIQEQHPEAGKAVQVAQQLQTALEETPEQFSARQAKLRQDAIAQLNAKEISAKTSAISGDSVAQNPPNQGVSLQETSATEPKKRRGRKPKNEIDLGPSQAPVAAPIVVPEAPKPSVVLVPAPQAAPEATKAVEAPIGPPVSQKPRLTQEQVKPYRQRLFRLVNDHLEPAGFLPKEGMGNADKLRNLAGIMFPMVQNMNELTVEQWETYLGSLEQKVQKEGASSTVKYIEDAIGI